MRRLSCLCTLATPAFAAAPQVGEVDPEKNSAQVMSELVMLKAVP